MKDAGGQRAINVCCRKDLPEVFARPGTARGDQRYAANGSYRGQLLAVITSPNAVLIHAVQHDFAGTTLLDFLASEKAGLQPFIGGFMLMLGLVAYLYVTRES